VTGCRHRNQQADIPDIQSLYDHIASLDTLIGSEQVDSIGNVNDHVAEVLTAYKNRAQSPEDVAILDSLTRIYAVASEFTRFCTSTKDNLDILRQDLKNLENQYRSGKITSPAYIAALLEVEQIIIDIRDEMADKNQQAIRFLRNQLVLVESLSTLPVPGN